MRMSWKLSNRKLVTMVIGGVLLVMAACGGGGEEPVAESPAGQSGNRMIQVETTRDLRFTPGEIGASPGETVEFVVKDTSGFFHTFTIATSSSKETILTDVRIEGNERKPVTFTIPNDAQDLYLFCRPHELAGMTGTIEVR